MIRNCRSKKNRGQTALEYALVIGVIAVGVIFAGRKLFSEPGSKAEQIMSGALDQAQKAINP
jgi:Flp pilus assembly pilin Flp